MTDPLFNNLVTLAVGTGLVPPTVALDETNLRYGRGSMMEDIRAKRGTPGLVPFDQDFANMQWNHWVRDMAAATLLLQQMIEESL